MALSRRGLVLSSAIGLVGGLARPALGEAEPIRLGWLAALTGPSSAPAIGFNRGVLFAADEINAAGGRRIEIITRDTQGDPTKAVNATQDLISRQKVHAIWGPTNSGEALATTPIMARARMPNLHPCVVESLIDPDKNPNAFRTAPSNGQWDDAVRHYCLDILKARDIAVLGDTTGYGTTAVGASVAAFKKDGANVVYQAQIDTTQPDVTPDLLRARNAGATAIVIWSVTTGMHARLMNVRATMGWDVPFVGHPALGSGDVRALLDKPANWDNVYIIGYRSCSYDASGRLPPRTEAFVAKLAGRVELADTSLWWVACAYDAVQLVAKTVTATASTAPAAIIDYWNTIGSYPGIYGDYAWTARQHNGYPPGDIVMSLANSSRNGAFAIAPGYA
jgi:branched-chain amino acid transport system substrate-binding protein